MSRKKYKWLMGEVKDFTAANDYEFLCGLRSTQQQCKTDDRDFMRDMAMITSDWTGKPASYSDVASLRRSMIEAGAIQEVTDAGAQ